MFYILVAAWIIVCIIRAFRAPNLLKAAPCLGVSFTLIALMTYLLGTLTAALYVFAVGMFIVLGVLFAAMIKQRQTQ